MGFRTSRFWFPAIPLSCHPNYRALTFALAGLSPAEHTSLNWTHFRTAGFPRYGWKAGFQMGPSRLPRELKSAPDIRGVFASLHPSFVHLVIQRLSRTEPGRGFDRAPP